MSSWKHVEDREMVKDSQCVFSKGSLCLTILLAFYNGAIASVNKESEADIICLDSCRTFDTVPHKVLTSKFER